MIKKITSLVVIIFAFSISPAQNIKFGKVSKQELEEKYYPLDSSVNAAILYKKRRTHYDYLGDEGWELITKVHERIKIYNKEGYDWATKVIKLYTQGGKDESVSIKAYTFNLINNKVEKIKLKNSEVFKENINKYWNSKKFTMANIKEGSIVEWEYTIRSPYYWRIDDMLFQYKIPLKHIDTEIRIPEYFVFKYFPSTYYPVLVTKTSKHRTLNFNYRSKDEEVRSVLTTLQTAKVELSEKVYSRNEKNIPAIKDEPYTNNINNYKSKTSFELTSTEFPNSLLKFYNNTWEDVTKTIYKSPNFGGQLEKTSHFKEDLENLVNNTAPLNQRIIKILQFVKNKIKWDGYYG